MQLISTFEFGGAERLAVTISAQLPKDLFNVSVCGFYGGEGPLVEDLKKNGVRYYCLDAGCRNKIAILYVLHKILRQQKVDILQVHGAYFLLLSYPVAWFAGVKVVYTEHAQQSITHYASSKFAAKFFSQKAEGIVCVSRKLANFFQYDLKVPAEKLQVIHNGIDVPRFQTAFTPFSLSGQRKIVGCVARLTEAKDHKNLLEAFSLLVQRWQDVTLVIVGEGEMRPAIEMQIESLKLGEYVKILGNRNDIPEVLAGIDIFVLASKREGFPVSILEAMAAGRPVVATDVGGVSEVIRNGYNGLIVPAGMPNALADALHFLLDNQERALEMAVNGRNDVQQQFGVGIMMEKYAALFLKVCSAP